MVAPFEYPLMNSLLELTDSEIVHRLHQDDERAYRVLFDRHYTALVISAFQILKDEAASKDAAQEVFLHIWNKRKSLNLEMHFGSYLTRGVVNRAINILKSRRHHTDAGPEPLTQLSSPLRRPDDELEDLEFEKLVYQAIDELPDRCRAIFMLRRMEHCTHDEIAERLDISKKTIENQMTKALKIIRKAIQQYTALHILWTLLCFWS